MKTLIKVQVRSAYGNDRIYPVCPTARKFCELTGRKTLLPADVKAIRELGFEIEFVPSTITLEDL